MNGWEKFLDKILPALCFLFAGMCTSSPSENNLKWVLVLIMSILGFCLIERYGQNIEREAWTHGRNK